MKHILTASAIFIGLSGCSSDDSAANLSAVVTNDLLNGTWLRGCEVSEASSFNVTAYFNNGDGNLFATAYADTSCTTVAMINSTIDFTYTIGNDVNLDGSVAGITTVSEINFDFTGSPSFDLAAIVNTNTLYFGDTDSNPDYNGDTVARRAIKLDPTSYIKQ